MSVLVGLTIVFKYLALTSCEQWIALKARVMLVKVGVYSEVTILSIFDKCLSKKITVYGNNPIC